MLKFFRHIRKKLIEQNKVRNYFFYAVGEIALVMIGILLALQVNNWNENRKERATAQMLMKELLENLKYDIIRCEVNYERNISLLQGLDSLREEIKRIKKEKNQPEKLYYFALKYSIDYHQAIFTDAAFQELQNKSASQGIQDRDLMVNLLDYYERITFATNEYQPGKYLENMLAVQSEIISYTYLDDLIDAYDSISSKTFEAQYDFKDILLGKNLTLRNTDDSQMESYYTAVARYEMALKNYNFWLDFTRERASSLVQEIKAATAHDSN